MLIGAIELMKAENTPQHKKMVSDEMVKATYLCPVKVTPVPEVGSTKLSADSQVQFPVLAAPDGKQYFMAFTDMAELKKWRDEEAPQTLAMTFEDYAAVMLKNENQNRQVGTAGLVINPFGINIVVPKSTVVSYAAAKMEEGRPQV